MNDTDKKAFFLDFIRKRTLGVISTTHADGTPQAAVIGIGETDQLELLFGTFNTTRKYKNIQANPSVAVVIGWENGETVQYEGVARELTPEEIHLIEDHYWTKNPGAKRYYTDEHQRYFIVTPKWIRYTDMKTEPRTIIELDFSQLQ